MNYLPGILISIAAILVYKVALNSTESLQDLEDQLLTYLKEEAYEKCAEIRDRIKALKERT